MQGKERTGRRLTGLAVLALAAFGVGTVVLGRAQISQVLVQANWWLVAPALACAALSYACLSYSFAAICRVFGVRLGGRDLFEIGFVSWALNHLVAAGGAAGYSLRALLIHRRGLPVRDVLAASLLHSALNNLMLFLLAPAGLVYLLLAHPLSASLAATLGAAACALLLLNALFWIAVFVNGARAAALRVAGRFCKKVLRRDISSQLEDLGAAFGRGVREIRRRPRLLAAPVALTFLDWAASLGTLWFCLCALDVRVGPGVLVTGFAAGVIAGLVSMVPGGLGVQDGSMAAVYALLGVPLREAVLAAILFRLVYYVVPFLLSLIFYRRLLRKVPDLHSRTIPAQTGPRT